MRSKRSMRLRTPPGGTGSRGPSRPSTVLIRIATCTECGSQFGFSGRRGPAPLSCSDPCAAKRAKRYHRQSFSRNCSVCGKPFTTGNRLTRCCGSACGNILRKRASDATRKLRTAQRRVRICEQCGIAFFSRNPSGRARQGKTKGGTVLLKPLSNSSAAKDGRAAALKKRGGGSKVYRLKGLRPEMVSFLDLFSAAWNFAVAISDRSTPPIRRAFRPCLIDFAAIPEIHPFG